jgi:hypothetical protein
VPYSCAVASTWLRVPELTLPDGTRCQPVPGSVSLPGGAVDELLGRADIADFTGPVVPVTVEQDGVRPLWLPVYLVECADRPLVFGRSVDGPDPYLADLMVQRPVTG